MQPQERAQERLRKTKFGILTVLERQKSLHVRLHRGSTKGADSISK